MEKEKSLKKRKRILSGVVLSDKMDKTIVLGVEMRKTHPLYGKVVRNTKKIKAHDENNTCNVGDTVKVVEARPLSREKSWRLLEVVERAK